MTTAKLKIEIGKALKNTESPAVLELIYSILLGQGQTADKRITKKQYNQELRQSVEAARKGKKISHKAAIKRLEKW
jgi:hypothetical protein